MATVLIELDYFLIPGFVSVNVQFELIVREKLSSLQMLFLTLFLTSVYTVCLRVCMRARVHKKHRKYMHVRGHKLTEYTLVKKKKRKEKRTQTGHSQTQIQQLQRTTIL